MYTDIVCCLLYIYIYTYSYIYTIYKHVIWLVVYESNVFASFWVELSLHLMYKSSKPWMVIWWPSAGLMRRWVRMAVCILSPLASKSCASFVWAMILSCWPVRCTIFGWAGTWMTWLLVRFQWDLANLSMLWFRNPKAYIMWFTWWIPGYEWSDMYPPSRHPLVLLIQTSD